MRALAGDPRFATSSARGARDRALARFAPERMAADLAASSKHVAAAPSARRSPHEHCSGSLRPHCRAAHEWPADAGPRWGLPEFFVISQTAIPGAAAICPGRSRSACYIRIASFAISFATLLWWAVAVGQDVAPASPASRGSLPRWRYVVLMFFHPLTYSTFAALAQFVLYLSVIAPDLLGWQHSCERRTTWRRLMALLLICNGLNAVVGVLQVYDPGRWMPPEMSRLMTESLYGLGTVTYRGPTAE